MFKFTYDLNLIHTEDTIIIKTYNTNEESE